MGRVHSSLKDVVPRLGVDGSYSFPGAEDAFNRYYPLNESVDLERITSLQQEAFRELDGVLGIVERLSSYLDTHEGSFGGISYTCLTFNGIKGGYTDLLLPTVYLLEDAVERDWRLYWMSMNFHLDFSLGHEYGKFGEKSLIGWHSQIVEKENLVRTILIPSK